MLGSNDLLQSAGAEGAAAHMAQFLRQLPRRPVLLVSPPPMIPGTWVQEDRLLREDHQLREDYRLREDRQLQGVLLREVRLQGAR